jgi:hypothetical protein
MSKKVSGGAGNHILSFVSEFVGFGVKDLEQ